MRQILDIGKGHYKDRVARLIVCILIGCIAFAANIMPHDKALMSRFYHAISRGLTDDTIDKTKAPEAAPTPAKKTKGKKKVSQVIDAMEVFSFLYCSGYFWRQIIYMNLLDWWRGDQRAWARLAC